jgi:signal transduction histidine kinase
MRLTAATFGRTASPWYENDVSTPRDGRSLPFVPVPILLVVALALLVTFGVGLFGLTHLASESDAQARLRCSFLAETLAARLSVTPPQDDAAVLALAARRAAEAELFLVADTGALLTNLAQQAPRAGDIRRYLAQGSGEAQTAMGRSMFAAARVQAPRLHDSPLAPQADAAPYVLAFVHAPSPPLDAKALVAALLALTFLLVLVAGSATYSVAFDALRDIKYVTHRIQDMTRVTNQPAGEYVAARTMDEVGMLTVAFNDLHDRFVEAEARYRGDLSRAREQDQNRAAFLAAVSHELRSPLHAILGFADVLESEVDGPLSPGAREDVEQIRASGTHLSRLISDILEFSALEGGQLRLKLERCELRAIAAEVVREALALIGPRPIALTLLAERPVFFMGDPTRVRQVLGNLVGNALKFTQAGFVRVRVWEERGEACVSVLDTGPGIRPEERAMIFDDFKQSKQERMKRRGTGLGLAIARRLVALHGAKIKLASDVGRGSEFRVVFRALSRMAPATSLPRIRTIPPSAESHGVQRVIEQLQTASAWIAGTHPVKTVPPPPPPSSSEGLSWGPSPHPVAKILSAAPPANGSIQPVPAHEPPAVAVSPDDTLRSDFAFNSDSESEP